MTFRKATMPILAAVSLLTSTNILAQQPSQAYKGWPEAEHPADIRAEFANPPAGYGNVPFYWWTGDPLDIDRLTEQLEILSDASTDGLCVSYNHTHASVDTVLNAQGHGYCGRVSGGEPRVLSDDWRVIWNEYSKRCAAKGIGLGMDDYVIAWNNNGEFIDDIRNQKGFREYPGLLKTVTLGPKDKKPAHILKSEKVGDSTKVIYAAPAPELNPDYGKQFVKRYFQAFEDSMDSEGRKGMNYFFQDELQYDIKINSWCKNMRAIFKERKGYDILPHLDALLATSDDEVSEEDAKIRMDYAEVVTELGEEIFFKPIFNWNASRGLIYGCDNEGRGLRPTQYLDYFRAISWFTAPGNDAPARGSSFTQTKVSSSVAHLYGRPRTWLEAFHSMGWDANGGVLTHQLDHHIIAGGNLLCMHGLYYSTHGGWWEWAPPCFHFRMPYWPHMKYWLKYAERMCYLLSQGSHVCDIAILYPTETMHAYPQATPALSLAVSGELSQHGLDYDFIDYQSIRNAQVSNGMLSVAGENYKVIVLSDIRAMHSETISKLKEFQSNGGIVIAIGQTCPDFPAGTIFPADSISALCAEIKGRITPDFSTKSGIGKVLHRRIGENDVYMIMDVAHGDEMTFRASGKAESWDALHGTMAPLAINSNGNGKTTITYDGPDGNSMLVVFGPGEPIFAGNARKTESETGVSNINGEWDIEIIPTMNNKWGDFRLPASEGCIGVEARQMRYMRDIKGTNWSSIPCDVYGYGPKMLTTTLPSSVNLDEYLAKGIDTEGWKPYVWSWQYGVFDSPGSQGWHGLKCKVEDRFLILDQGGHQLFRTYVYAPESAEYKLGTQGVTPSAVIIDGEQIGHGSMAKDSPVSYSEIKLEKGWHSMLVAYANTKQTAYTLEGMRSGTIDRRDRSMVVILPASASDPAEREMYEDIVASKWFEAPHLEYDIYGTTDEWTYQFETAPGTQTMELCVTGEITGILIDGKKADAKYSPEGRYHVQIAKPSAGISTVTVSGRPAIGFAGPAFFVEPVRMECSGGKMKAGDWTEAGALRFFSGGIRYSKTISMESIADKVVLDLGEVDATCEVAVNGKKVDVLLNTPYSLDITSHIHEGENKVEVLVYSSLANHYLTIPSPYRGTARAGLLGPVRLVSYKISE